MKIITLYEYWDDDAQGIVRHRIPKEDCISFKLYTVIADKNHYLYNLKTGMIKTSVTIPTSALADWEERMY